MQAGQFLECVKVLDLSQYIPGPFATRQLADLGAQVIKIEPPSGDPIRYFMQQNKNDPSAIYQHLNRGKYICQLDLKTDTGKQRLHNLLVDADVLLESFRPGVLDRLGFDRNTLESINHNLIHCALSGYGQTGPYRDIAGHDLNYCAASGALDVNKKTDRPVITYPPLADHAGAMQASLTILAALHASQQQKQYIYIDISLFETTLSWQYLPLIESTKEYSSTLNTKSILGGSAACYNIYACKDGSFISLAALETHFWRDFCEAVEKPVWISRHFQAMPQTELISELSNLFAEHPRKYWDQLFSSVDCCYEPVLLPDELNSHPQIQSRNSLSKYGPNYPAKFNGNSVDLNVAFTELDPNRQPAWSN